MSHRPISILNETFGPRPESHFSTGFDVAEVATSKDPFAGMIAESRPAPGHIKPGSVEGGSVRVRYKATTAPGWTKFSARQRFLTRRARLGALEADR
jgi:hypothetical protein